MPPPRAIPETQADRDRVAAVLTTCASAWRYARDLAGQLGICATALSRYMSGERSQGVPVLLGSMRVTALRHPEAVPAILQTLAREVMDQDVIVLPVIDAADLASVEAEAGDVSMVLGLLIAAHRAGDVDAVQRYAQQLEQETHELASAARGAR